MESTATDTSVDLKLTSSDSDTNPPGYRPWTRLYSALSLATASLTPADVFEELVLRIPQLQKPLNPYPPRNPESLKKLKNALNDAKAKAGVSIGSSDAKKPDEPKGFGPLSAPRAGGNPLLALATANAAKEKGKDKEKEQEENTATLKTDGTKADLSSNISSAWEGPITDAMVENALIISEEFGIDEIESFMLFRSMLYNRGDIRKAATVGSSESTAASASTPKLPDAPAGTSPLGTSAASKSMAEGLSLLDSTSNRTQIIGAFATFYNEELLALLQSLITLCTALTNSAHPYNAVAGAMITRVLDFSRLDVRPPNYSVSASQKLSQTATKQNPADAFKERLGLLGPEVTHSPLHPVEFMRDLVAEYAIRAGVPIPSTPSWLTSSLGAASLADRPRAKYRSKETSQVLLEEYAIMELIFWTLWAGLCPPPPVSLDILTVAYACDLGAKMSPSSNAPSSASRSYANGSTSGTYLYLEDADKVVLRKLEVLWLLVTLSLFDIAHLLSGPIELYAKRKTLPSAVTGPMALTIIQEPSESDLDDSPKRVYDSRLLPALHSILANTPPNPRYSPVLLAWAFALACVSRAAVSAGEGVAKEYIPFLQQIIPEYSIDTITDRANDAGTWLSSVITSYCITEANVTGYLEACLRGTEEDEKRGGGLFDGEKGRRNPLSFGPAVYRVVIKRLLLAIPSMLALPRLPPNYIASYLSCFTTLFSHGPSLPELSNDYWDNDVVVASRRVIFDVVGDAFPLAGAAYPLNGGLEGMIRLQRSLSGAGSWELEGGDDLSSIAESSFNVDRTPGSSYGFYTAAPTKNKTTGGGIATIEAYRDEVRRYAARYVFHYFDQTESYAMVLQQSGPLGFRNLWETGIDNPPSLNGSFSASAGEMYYTNLHPLLLPGGSILPAKSRGYLLSGGSGKPLVIRWTHRHSGWSLLLEILNECAGRTGKSTFKTSTMGPTPQYPPGNVHATPHPGMQHLKRGGGKPIPFTLSAIGIDFSTIDIPNLIIEILDLFRSVIMHKDDASHNALFESMEQSNDPAFLVEPIEDDQSNESAHRKKMDLTQVVVQILSDALVRAGSKRSFTNAASAAAAQDLKMITSAISTLSAVARVLPERVWPLMRSTGLIGLAGGGYGFGASPSSYIPTGGGQAYYQQSNSLPQSTTIAVLASERATGHYRITLSILSLVRSLFDNAVARDLSGSVRADLKGEVLTNALRFIHSSIWCEHFGWKYRRLGDRFEIGKRIMGLYCDVLRNWTAIEGGDDSSNGQVFRAPAMFLLEVFLNRATQAAITPLVHSINIAQDLSRALRAANRNAEEAELVSMLQCFLDFASLILTRKRVSSTSTRQCLLEHLLCTGMSQNSVSITGSRQPKVVPIDTVANLISAHGMGGNITLYATELLSSLVLSLANVEPSPPSLVTHMTDAEETINQLVGIVRSMYEHPKLRKIVWRFMANAVEYQPALATLLVTGSFLTKPYALEGSKDVKGKGKEGEKGRAETTKDGEPKLARRRSAFNVAIQTAPFWEDLWKSDPAVLCAILRFLNVVWRHGLKHSVEIEEARKDAPLWKSMAWVLRNQVAPQSDQTDSMDVDGLEKLEAPAYQTLLQAYAVEIFALELGAQRRASKPSGSATPLPITTGFDTNRASFMAAKNLIQVGDSLKKHLHGAVATALDVNLQRRLVNHFQTSFPDFFFDALQSPLPSVQRDFGTGYLYSISLLEPRLLPEMVDRESQNRLRQMLNDTAAVNCNWSLVDSQIELTRAWKRFLQEGNTTLQQDAAVAMELFRVSVQVSQIMAKEERTGKTMTTIHSERLGLLLALLESTWSLSLTSSKEVTQLFMELLRNIHDIVTSESFPPINSIRQMNAGDGATFHRQLLQIAYFCSRKARTLFKGASYITAEQRAVVASTMLVISTFVSSALSEIFEMAKVQTRSWDLDRDMELLVTVFEQCTRPELHTSPRLWLERIQELDLARSSLEILAKCDLSGATIDGSTLRTYRHPPYARHILALQLCLSSTSAPAETLALAGAISAYSNISIANELTVGTLDTLHPELPGDRNPGQQAWCTILTIVAGLVGTVGRSSGHFVETEITSFIQLYGAELSKALEWNVGQPLSSGALEEMEAIMELFYAMSLCVNPRSAADAQSLMILTTFAEKSLILLQHLNYALSHPNLLASLFEPTTSEERRALDKEINTSMEMSSAVELLDSDKRPFIASLTQRMHVVVRDILSTLVIVNRGDEVIIQEPDDWPTTVQIAPTTKVTVGELATMGTLVEMANGIIELLEYLKPSQKAKLPIAYFTPPFDSDADILHLGQSLESIAIFSVSQLAVWQHQMEVGDSNMDEDGGMEWDDTGFGKESLAVRLGGKRSAVLPGLGGDVLADLLSMLAKAKAALLKAGLDKEPSKSMITILERFLDMRVIE